MSFTLLLRLPEAKGFSFAGLWARNDNLGVTSCHDHHGVGRD